MAYRKQLKDKDGNTIYPDVGLNLDDVVYSDDPESVGDDYIDPASYSTTEHKTGGTWIDGKPIYKKTFDFGTLPNNSIKTMSLKILNIGQIIDIKGITQNSAKNTRPLPMVGQDIANMVRIDVNGGTTLRAQTTTDWSSFYAYITIYYTKTTD